MNPSRSARDLKENINDTKMAHEIIPHTGLTRFFHKYLKKYDRLFDLTYSLCVPMLCILLAMMTGNQD